MANKKSTDRSKLVNGCGTILKSKRLKHGYTLVTRKRGVKTTTSATTTSRKGKKGSPLKMTEEVIVLATTTTAPKRGQGRPLGSKNKSKKSAPKKMSTVMTSTTPMKLKVGSPAKSKSVMMKASIKLGSPKKRRVPTKA